MSKRMVKQYSPEFKLKVVLEVLKEEETVSQIASKYEIVPKNIQNWKKQFLDNAELAFNKEQVIKVYKEDVDKKQLEIEELYKETAILITVNIKNYLYYFFYKPSYLGRY